MAELVQAQLKLELGFTSTKILGIALINTNYYILLECLGMVSKKKEKIMEFSIKGPDPASQQP